MSVIVTSFFFAWYDFTDSARKIIFGCSTGSAIEAIKMDMNLTEWTGDPCVPVPHNWLNCTLDAPSKLYAVTGV